MSKIGIFGGSFDPPHLGHLKISKEILQKKIVEKIYFMPTFIQPFKQDKKVSPPEKRLEMVKKLATNDTNFFVLDYEIKNKNISYTYESLKHLKKNKFKSNEIFFIQGEDTFFEIEKWYKSENLLKEFNFIVAYRKIKVGKKCALKLFAKKLAKKYRSKIILLENDYIDISSTKIRELLTEGKTETVAKLMPFTMD
jgi:nicotinate-nucleotide adenylyltransferase